MVDAVTRLVMENGWTRNLGLHRTTAAQVQAGIESVRDGGVAHA